MNLVKPHAVRALALAVAVTLSTPSLAAFDAFLKLGDIKGESTDDKHKDEIEIASWSFGATSRTSASGLASSRPCLSDISLVKPVDKSTPLLLGAAMAGTRIGTAVLTARKKGEQQQDYLVVTIKDVLVSSVSQSSAGDGGLPMEGISLSYSTMEIKYFAQKPDGSMLPAVQATVNGKC